MPDLRINGEPVTVPDGTSVAAAILIAGVTTFRRSVTGQSRGPLCGMGICFECRATIDGVPHQRTCQLPARTGMEIQTDAAR
jgi:hypothetical protein